MIWHEKSNPVSLVVWCPAMSITIRKQSGFCAVSLHWVVLQLKLEGCSASQADGYVVLVPDVLVCDQKESAEEG